MIRNVAVVTRLVAASAITDAKIGPTQGVQTIPIVKPITNPPQNPACGFAFGASTESLVKSFSIIV